LPKNESAPTEARIGASTTYLISQVHFALRSRTEAALKKYAVTGIQYTVLSVLAHRDGLSSADLSRRFYVTPQSMGQLLSSLEERGLLARNEDMSNRRILRVSLTDAGRELVEAGAKDIAEVESLAFAILDGNDLQRLRSNLHALVGSLRGITPQPVPGVDGATQARYP
jgi:DNA-binding MarR family transcriptional regulator